MRYNIKLFWNYIIYLVIGTLAFLVPLTFHGFELKNNVTFYTDIKENLLEIWIMSSIVIFTYFFFSIKSETKWKKIKPLDYLTSGIMAMIQGSFMTMSFTMISSIIISGIPGVKEGSLSSIATGITLYFLTMLAFGVPFVIFVSALWYKSSNNETEELLNISLAIRKSFLTFFKGWTLMTNSKIKLENNEIINFNLMMSTKNIYIIKNLNHQQSQRIQLGGKEIIEEDGKKTTEIIKPSNYIDSFEILTNKVETYLNNFYSDPLDKKAKLELIPVICYSFDKNKKPVILGDVKNKLIISDKDFGKEISQTEHRLIEKQFINKTQIINNIDKYRI